MKLNKKRYAFCMMLLIVSLSVHIPITFANIQTISASGSAGIENIVETKDTISFKTKVSLEGDSLITPNQVQIGTSEEFDSCKPVVGGFECSLRFPETGETEFDLAAVPFTISLKDDNGRTKDQKSGALYVDNKPPVIEILGVDQSLVNTGSVKFDYRIREIACTDSSCSGKCSGLGKIELRELDGSYAQTFPVDSPSCITQNTLIVPTTKFLSGEHTVFMKAFDKLGHASIENSVTFTLDKDEPFIDVGTFRIVDDIESDIEYFHSPVPVTAKIEIKDKNLDKTTVIADLSEVGGPSGVVGNCNEIEEGVTECSWNFILRPIGEGLKKITIEASDTTKNPSKSVVTRNFVEDNNPPQLLSLDSTQVIDGISFAKLRDNTFIAIFSDEVGVSPSDAVLKAAGQRYFARECEKESLNWKCTWDGVSFTKAGDNLVFVQDTTTDRVGNELEKTFSKTVTIDDKKPVLVDLKIQPALGDSAPIPDITKTGDRLAIEVHVQDEFIASATADLSKFISGAAEVPADRCDRKINTTDEFVCVWTTDTITIPGYINNFVTIGVSDAAGNILEISEKIIVYGTDDSEADLWDYSVQCSPELLDRELFELIDKRAFCHVALHPNAASGAILANLEPVSIELGRCSGDTSYVKEAKLYNNDKGSHDPYIGITFEKQQARINQLVYECELLIHTKQGKTIFVNPEREFIQFSYQFYNMPLGELSDSLQGKIDTAIDDATGLLSFIGTLKKIVFYAEQACGFANQIQNAINVLNLITGSLGTANVATFGGSELARFQSCVATESLATGTGDPTLGGLDKFCKFVNCQQSPVDSQGSGEASKWFSWMGKWQQGGDRIIGAAGGDIIKEWTGKAPVTYMNAKDSIVVATLTACIPGIINGIDKYRQIQCLYADCMKTAVGEQGLPIYVCEDQKAYATCKYVVGEIFSVIPFTALFDHYAVRIKNMLSDPFEVLGFVFGASCEFACPDPTGTGHQLCRAAKIAARLAHTVQSVASILDGNLFEPPKDYCETLEEYVEQKEAEEEAQSEESIES